MHIPEKRTLRLVEIQFTVLPEAEWLIGISDLSYFQGLGFSLPVPFDEKWLQRDDDPLLRGGKGHSHISLGFDQSDVIEEVDECIVDDALLLQSEEDGTIQCSNEEGDGSPIPTACDIENFYSSIDSESISLYAFLPGLFYCSIHNTSVDGILVEISQKELLGNILASFRPENVRSFDFMSGLAVDEGGTILDVNISMETMGRFATGLSERIAESLVSSSDADTLNEVKYTRELEIAENLMDFLPIEDLKRAYVSGSILTGQVLTILHDIEQNGLSPRFRIYVKNHIYPEGKVVDVRYQGIEGILTLNPQSGVECPKEIILGQELRMLSFARLIGMGKEVDIEEAILDIFNFFYEELTFNPEKDQIMKIIFREENDVY